jgi:hypothetical protein
VFTRRPVLRLLLGTPNSQSRSRSPVAGEATEQRSLDASRPPADHADDRAQHREDEKQRQSELKDKPEDPPEHHAVEEEAAVGVESLGSQKAYGDGHGQREQKALKSTHLPDGTRQRSVCQRPRLPLSRTQGSLANVTSRPRPAAPGQHQRRELDRRRIRRSELGPLLPCARDGSGRSRGTRRAGRRNRGRQRGWQNRGFA